MVVTSDICTSSPEGTGVCIFWDRAEPLFETTLTDVCCSGWSVFYGAGLWSSVSVSEHMCPLWALLLQIIGKGGSSVRQTSAQNKRWMIFFVLFCFHGTRCFPTARCLRLNAWVVFFFFMWLCCVCVLSDWRKMWGSVMSEWCFSVKLGNLMTHVAKTSPSESLIRPLHFLPLFAWCKLSPKLNGCDFSFLQFIVACVIYWDHLFNLCLIYFMGWPDPQKGFSKI